MPEIINKNSFSIDSYFYKQINDSSNDICILEPNYVTLLNIILSIFIAYLFYYDYHILLLMILMIIRTYLDILDGGIARRCNKYSELGKQLDLSGDIILYILLIYVGYLKIPNESMTLKNSILLCLIIGIVLYINCLITEYNFIKNIKLFSFIHDNTMVFIPLSFYIYYLIINKIKEST